MLRTRIEIRNGAKHPIELWMHPRSQRKGHCMLRRSAILLFSLLLTATLLWGGCVVCPQFFQAPLASNSCCDPSGHCGTPQCPTPRKVCHYQQVELQQPTSVKQVLDATPLWLMFIPAMLPGPSLTATSKELLHFTSEPPHDRQALFATFLI